MARPFGARSRSTIEREEKAKAEIARAVRAGRAAGKADPRAAMDEIYRLYAEAESVTSKLKPRDIILTKAGIKLVGGDWKSFSEFREWFDRLIRLTELMAKYQMAPIKATELPSPAPDPAKLERDAKIVFGLRVFEGGMPVTPYGEDNDDDTDLS